MATVISVAAAIISLVGVLGTALIARRTKSMELIYAKKADAYRDYLQETSVIAHTSETQEHYPDYLRAYHAARLVASPEVQAALTDEDGINQAVQKLRWGSSTDYARRESIRSNEIHHAMERVIGVMNSDLGELIG